jgi:hypothetical protein
MNLIFQLSRRYSQMQRMTAAGPSVGNVDAIDELRNAFELAERSSPGITEILTQLILARVQPPGPTADDRARAAVDRLTRPN